MTKLNFLLLALGTLCVCRVSSSDLVNSSMTIQKENYDSKTSTESSFLTDGEVEEKENDGNDIEVEEGNEEETLVDELQAIKDGLVEKGKKLEEVTTPSTVSTILSETPPQLPSQAEPASSLLPLKDETSKVTEQQQQLTTESPSTVKEVEEVTAPSTVGTILSESPLQPPTQSEPASSLLARKDETPKVTKQQQQLTTESPNNVKELEEVTSSSTVGTILKETSPKLPPLQPPSQAEPASSLLARKDETPKVTKQKQQLTTESPSNVKEVEEVTTPSTVGTILSETPPQLPSQAEPASSLLPLKDETSKVTEQQQQLTTESPSTVKNIIGRGSFTSVRRQFTRPPPTHQYDLEDDSVDFEPYYDNEYHPVLASFGDQKSNEEVERMLQQNSEKDLLLEEADPISPVATNKPFNETEVNETTTTSPEVNKAKMPVEQENQIVTEGSRSVTDVVAATFLNDPTIIVYTLFCVFCLSIIKFIKWFLRPKLIEAPSKKIEPPSKKIEPPSEMLGSTERFKIKTQLEKEVKILKDKNLLLSKVIQRLPVIKGRKEVAEKLVKAKSQLAVLRQYNLVDQKNSELKKKMLLSKYNQMLMIQNFVHLENLLELMRVIEFMNLSNSLRESAFAMKVECDFLREQISLFRDLAKRFREDYLVLSNEIALEKKKESAIEEEYTNLKNLCDELDLDNSIDDWKRKIAAKETETDRYYKDYINNYYRYVHEFQPIEVS